MKKIIIVFVVILFSSLQISAQDTDDQGNTNDPAINDRANACFEGGSMEGKCDTEWEWVCGWHLIRLDSQNQESRYNFPSDCASLLPALIIPEVIPNYPGTGCVLWWSQPIVPVYQSSDFQGGNYLPFGHSGWTSHTLPHCTGTPQAYVALAYAPGGFAIANEICISHGHPGAVSAPSRALSINNVYVCI